MYVCTWKNVVESKESINKVAEKQFYAYSYTTKDQKFYTKIASPIQLQQQKQA